MKSQIPHQDMFLLCAKIGLVSLLNGISTFVGCLMPTLP